jgi:primosomal protein N'
MPPKCPRCKKGQLYASKMGGQRILQEIKKNIGRSVVTIDATTQNNKTSSQSIKKPSGKIIIATSAIHSLITNNKFNHIFWLFPEIDLLYPDFRSSEKAYYNLIRLSHHLDNQRKKINIITRQPIIIEKTLSLSPTEFTTSLLKERKRFSYPPYKDLIKITTIADNEKAALKKAQKIHQAIIEKTGGVKQQLIVVRGPFTGFIKRRHKKFEAHLTITGPLKKITPLCANLDADFIELSPERIL